MIRIIPQTVDTVSLPQALVGRPGEELIRHSGEVHWIHSAESKSLCIHFHPFHGGALTGRGGGTRAY
jgi:hypothetical protein